MGRSGKGEGERIKAALDEMMAGMGGAVSAQIIEQMVSDLVREVGPGSITVAEVCDLLDALSRSAGRFKVALEAPGVREHLPSMYTVKFLWTLVQRFKYSFDPGQAQKALDRLVEDITLLEQQLRQ